ncbi:hypothetical protein K3G39_08865 [Pontibacter sp. HSC-14F20]|uniref:hypothetical protein n=1 Tax=Pontibacter sp. HSC-14F20 TaxID=2864136 RepID=UPI001C732B82|nr:hypothetical protein [Pontibacter sp. HSC-14F20]MBX0333350.1 hypothetical protein [Pontibacter sp. HSC-14F20]
MFKKPLAAMYGLLISLTACQSPDNAQAEQTSRQETTVTADTTKREPRPKPEYYNFKGVERKRVYICMESTEDTFHQQHDCPVLITCKGQFRNLILARAIEDFDRYNCETCSADLGYIFDETYAPY